MSTTNQTSNNVTDSLNNPQLPPPPEVTSDLCTPQLVTSLDVNGDGYVEQREFATLIAQLLVQAKKDAATTTTSNNDNEAVASVRADDCQEYFASQKPPSTATDTTSDPLVMMDTTTTSDNNNNMNAVQQLLDTVSCLCLPFHAPDDRSPHALDCCRKTMDGARFAAPGRYDPAYDALVCFKTNTFVQNIVQQEQVQQQCAELLATQTNTPTLAPTTNMPTMSPIKAPTTTTTVAPSDEPQTASVAKPFVPNTDEPPNELSSVAYYQELRDHASETNALLDRPQYSNLDWFPNPALGLTGNTDPEILGTCHISLVLPFTGEDGLPDVYVAEDAAYVLLALQHLNTGDGSLVPQVQGLSTTCPIRFTMELADSLLEPGQCMQHVIDQTSRPYNGKRPIPCAFLGEYWSSNTIPMAIVSGLLGYPHMSAQSTSGELDDVSQFPLFGRTIPNDYGTAVPIVHYFVNVLKANHLVVLHVNDAYGNAFVEGIRVAARRIAPDLKLHQIPMEYDYDTGPDPKSIQDAVLSIQETRYRFVFAILYGAETHDEFLRMGHEYNVAANGLHNWFFADSFSGNMVGRTFDADDILAQAYHGTAVIEISGGVPGMPSYDAFVEQIHAIGESPTDLRFLGSKLPPVQGGGGGEIPFVNEGSFLKGALLNGYGPLAYEAIIALGLAACNSYNLDDNRTLSGAEHFSGLLETQFKAISGTVTLDNVTGTRTPESALFRVKNYVARPYPDQWSTTKIDFEPVTTDLFIDGAWVNQVPFTFNDGTSNIPEDMSPLDEQAPNWFLYIGVPLLVVFVALVVIFIFYENKRKQNDGVWQVKREELRFSEPPEIIGRGTFGLVLLGEYRGTQVAVKRVLPPRTLEQDGKEKGDKDPSESEIGTRSGISSSIHGSESGKMSYMGTSMFGATKQSESAVLNKLRQDFVEEMRYLSRLRHPCITTVMGAVIDKEDPMLVLEYMEHGSLHDLLQNETVIIGGETLLPILRDITQGVRFLHSADPKVIHGDLKAANILVDSRFRAKVADFGLSQKQVLGGTGTPFWMAPELLRRESANTTASDVYSFGIILYEVYSRKDPYSGENAEEVLKLVANKKINKRPPPPPNMSRHCVYIMGDCVDANPATRPSFEDLDNRLKRLEPSQVDPGQLSRNKTVSMNDIFPPHIASALMAGNTVEPEHRDCVTIFFCDIVGFTTISATLEPRKIASMLDRLYSKFDKISHELDIFKVETIGDAYMAVTNLVKDQEDHAKRIAEFSIEAIAAANETLIDEDAPEKGFVNIRVGFHSGSVVADVVGTRNPRYCLFGDTVNTASRMESSSEVNRIHCSKPAAKLLKKQWKDLPLMSRGRIEIKGKGKMHTFWVNESLDGELQQSASKLFASSEFMRSSTASRPSVPALEQEGLDALQEESSEMVSGDFESPTSPLGSSQV